MDKRKIYKKYWNGIMTRTGAKYKAKFETYEDAKNEFKDFAEFEKWCDKHMLFYCDDQLFDLDKDLLCDSESKVYSRETCCFLPHEINCQLRGRKRKNDLMQGIHQLHSTGKYQAYVNGVKLGLYDTYDDAVIARVEAKQEHLTELADYYRPVLEKRVYDKLVHYYF